MAINKEFLHGGKSDRNNQTTTTAAAAAEATTEPKQAAGVKCSVRNRTFYVTALFSNWQNACFLAIQLQCFVFVCVCVCV